MSPRPKYPRLPLGKVFAHPYGFSKGEDGWHIMAHMLYKEAERINADLVPFWDTVYKYPTLTRKGYVGHRVNWRKLACRHVDQLSEAHEECQKEVSVYFEMLVAKVEEAIRQVAHPKGVGLCTTTEDKRVDGYDMGYYYCPLEDEDKF